MAISPRSLGRPEDRRAALLLPPLLAFLIILLVVFNVFFQTFHVEGPSMQPNILAADRLLVTRGYDEPARGDLVVLSVTRRGVDGEVVKRVVGVAGDTVEVYGDRITVNGDTPYAPGAIIGPRLDAIGATTVPEAHVFVAGDNRAESLDSRFYGPIHLAQVKGRVVAVYAPVTRMRFVDDGPERD